MEIIESRAVVLEGKGLNRVMRVITPGMGSSGLYATEVLKEAVSNGIFDQGLHCFVDHPSVSENEDRPERSVRDLAAVATGPAIWNEADQAIDQPIKIYPHYSWLGDVAESIGMSIRASAEVSSKVIEGTSVRVIDKLTEAHSVDFVTRAGRGGKVLEAMESARDDLGLREALQSDFRDVLEKAVAEAYSSESQYAYVRDYDPEQSFVIVSIYAREADVRKMIKQGYSVSDSGVSLASDAIEVKIVTNYVPVQNVATEAKGHPIVEITEADHQALLNKIAEAEARATAAEEARVRDRADRDRKDAAEARVIDKIGTRLDHLPTVLRDRAVAEALRETPATESGALDESAFDQRVDKAVEAELNVAKAFAGYGTPAGHGHTEAPGSEPKQAAEAISRIPFNRPTVLKG